MNVRPPLRLQLRKVFNRPRVVSEEVHAADAVVLVEVDIYFTHCIVDVDIVGESVRDIDVWIIVRGEARPVARNRTA